MNDIATVFIIDDNEAVRAGMSRLLRSADYCVAAFPHAEAFLDEDPCSQPGCLLLDVKLPGLSGLELQRVLAERRSLLPIIFLTAHGDIGMGVQAMKAGAADFLTKPVESEQLLQAVPAAIEKNRAARATRAATEEILQRIDALTPREREVLPLVVAGQMNKQVAARLGTTEKTIKVHRARVMQKMKVRTLADLVHLADRVGIGAP